MNLFSLHGKHFRDDENRLTANLAIILHEARRGFLPAFLRRIGLDLTERSLQHLDIQIQCPLSHAEQRSVLDAKLLIKDCFVAIIESKIGFNSINPAQALKYARWLIASAEPEKFLVFISQIREPLIESSVLETLQREDLGNVRCFFLRWNEIFSLLRKAEHLEDAGRKRCETRIRKALPVPSSERLSYLFLNEVEKMAFDLSVMDDLLVGEVEDVVIQVQWRWFMSVALNYNIWFPPSTSLRGLRPAKYVAYYQTADNDLPKHLSHIARVRKVWRRLSFEDALVLPEFQSFFSDESNRTTVANFKNKEGLFHMALTDTPVALAHPIPLGNPSKAQFLTKKRFPVTRLLAAKTADDLFEPSDIAEIQGK